MTKHINEPVCDNGHSLVRDQRFCPECGAPAIAMPSNAPDGKVGQKPWLAQLRSQWAAFSVRTKAIIGAGVAAVAVLVVVLVSSGGSQDQQLSTADQAFDNCLTVTLREFDQYLDGTLVAQNLPGDSMVYIENAYAAYQDALNQGKPRYQAKYAASDSIYADCDFDPWRGTQ